MSRRPKYQLPRSRQSSSQILYWILAIALIAALTWILWWHSNQTSPPVVKVAEKPRAPEKPVAHLATPVPVPVPKATNRPPPAVIPVIPSPAPPARPGTWPRPVQNILEAQIALIGEGISAGSMDGALGSQTRAALLAFQRQQGLSPSGSLDAPTRELLTLNEPPYTSYVITSNDLARLAPVASTWLGKSQQGTLDYENILELVAEKSFAHPGFIRQLNPGIDWANVTAGTVLQVPNAGYPEPSAKAAWIRIHLSGKTLEAFDAATNLLAHFPCSIARRVEKRPVGELHIAVVAPNPNYTFDPEVFPESEEARAIGHRLVLPPGPNNPVGVAWIGLDKPGYGIHGTPRPEEVGRTESHGCFRLANWNAAYLLRLVSVGIPVYVEE